MNFKFLIAAGLLACLAASFVWQRRTITTLRQENQELLSLKAEAERLGCD